MSPKFIACVLFSFPAFSSAADKPAADETAMTIEGVRAVENHWTRAFLSGDAAYLDSLLHPQYVSVGHSGRARPKAEIIELSKERAANPSKDAPPENNATIVIHGNAAISTASSGGDTSVDVFYYESGRWHAWYSQHTPVKPPG